MKQNKKNVQLGDWLFQYRSFIPIILLITALCIYSFTLYNDSIILNGTKQTYFEIFAFIVSLLGLLIRFYTVGYTPKGTSGRNRGRQLADSLNTTGAYSVVRNPLYLANFFCWFGIAMLTQSLIFILVFFVFFYLFYTQIILTEERFLADKYGEQFKTWVTQTPRIIPRLSNFQRPVEPFNWPKVLRKEKNGVAAVFLVFGIFGVASSLFHDNNLTEHLLIEGSLSLGLIFFAGIYYLTIKILQKRNVL